MASSAQLEAKLKQAQNQLLALKNDVNEKELALLENDAAFAKQLFHMKKLLGEREKASARGGGGGYIVHSHSFFRVRLVCVCTCAVGSSALTTRAAVSRARTRRPELSCTRFPCRR
jgi:hypothetical protein